MHSVNRSLLRSTDLQSHSILCLTSTWTCDTDSVLPTLDNQWLNGKEIFCDFYGNTDKFSVVRKNLEVRIDHENLASNFSRSLMAKWFYQFNVFSLSGPYLAQIFYWFDSSLRSGKENHQFGIEIHLTWQATITTSLATMRCAAWFYLKINFLKLQKKLFGKS